MLIPGARDPDKILSTKKTPKYKYRIKNQFGEYWTDKKPKGRLGEARLSQKERSARYLKKNFPEGQITQTPITVQGKKYILPSIVKGTQQSWKRFINLIQNWRRNPTLKNFVNLTNKLKGKKGAQELSRNFRQWLRGEKAGAGSGTVLTKIFETLNKDLKLNPNQVSQLKSYTPSVVMTEVALTKATPASLDRYTGTDDFKEVIKTVNDYKWDDSLDRRQNQNNIIKLLQKNKIIKDRFKWNKEDLNFNNLATRVARAQNAIVVQSASGKKNEALEGFNRDQFQEFLNRSQRFFPYHVHRSMRSTLGEYLKGDKLSAANKKLSTFKMLTSALDKEFSEGFAGKGGHQSFIQFDHPLSLKVLENTGNLEGALRVNPIAGDINLWKKDLDKRIGVIQNRLAQGKLTTKEYYKTGQGVIDNKKALRSLNNMNKILFGEKSPEFTVGEKGISTVKAYGAPEFEKSKLISEFKSNIGLGETLKENIRLVPDDVWATTGMDKESLIRKLGKTQKWDQSAFEGFINKWSIANPKWTKILEGRAGCLSSGGRVGLKAGTGPSECLKNKIRKEPGLIMKAFRSLPKSGRIGAVIAGLGAVGGGAYALLAGDEAQADTMKYNATTGQFDDAEGEPETQEGILNWIADNPIKSGLAPIPALLGVSHFAPKAAARALTSFPALVAPALAAEKLYQYKEGVDPGDMALDPLNAIWALGWDSPKTGMGPAGAKGAYYAGLSDSQKLGLRKLATKQGWKDLPKAMKAGIMSPRAAGTKMVFPFAGPKAGAGIGSTLLRGGARLLPLGPIPLALSAGYYGWNKYKDIRDTNSILDSMREQGNITEEDADTLRTIMKQGWLGTTSLGAKILGSEELELGGEMIGLDQQKQVLDRLRTDVDEFQSGREDVTAKDRQQEFFNWFSDGGRVGMKTGGMDRRTFLKWIAGLAATATGLIKGKGITKAPVAKAVPKAVAKFQGVEGMPLWFPRAVAKIKAHGKLLSMADKDYVQGDIYEMMIPVTRKYLQRRKPGEGEVYVDKMEYQKVIMEENPLDGTISMQWTGTDNFGDDAVRQINFKPGEAGYQKFGVDPDHPTAWEYQRVKVDEPEFTYSQPDQSQPYRDDIEYLDIFQEGDEMVDGLQKMTGQKSMVMKDGTVMDVTDYSKTDKEIDQAFKKKIYKDIEGEDALLPDPEGHMTPEGWQGEGTPEFVEGDVPDWVPKDEWPKKASGGIIETGEIARRPGAVPPLSGPSPDGIMSLYSNPKQVNVG